MSHVWTPKPRRKCKYTRVCGWIGYNNQYCPWCGTHTVPADPFEPNQEKLEKMGTPKRNMFKVGIDL